MAKTKRDPAWEVAPATRTSNSPDNPGHPQRTAAPIPLPTAPAIARSGIRDKAALLQQIFEVAPLACPACDGRKRIVAVITQPSVIDQILTHRAARAAHRRGRGRGRAEAHSSVLARQRTG